MQMIISRGSSDIRVRADPDRVTSPIPRLVFKPSALRAPVVFAMGHSIPPLGG
jgi:hypothetical protein